MARRANDRSMRNGGWPERTQALKVEGGIRAHTKRGAFGQRWWAKRWIGVLESFGLGTRLARGRSYARAGQVTDIAIELGGVRANVQGSRAKPYSVTIRMREFTPGEWAAIGVTIAANARLCAMLLAGEMPEDIEAAFTAAGAPLFPKSQHELKTACSCPDWSNPCKHVAAVFYLVGEEFDRDPFLLFVVRGRERSAVAQLLAGPDADADAPKRKRQGATGREPRADAPGMNAAESTESATLDAASFWTTATRIPTTDTPVEPPQADAMLVARAGRFPFWRAEIALADTVAPMYASATLQALEWLADHPGTGRLE